MDWTLWLELSPTEFARRLRRRLSKPFGRNDFMALFNALLLKAQDDPRGSAAIADAITPLVTRRRPKDAIMMLELYAVLVGQALARGLVASTAMSAAIVLLQRLTVADALAVLQEIGDEDVRRAATGRLANAPENGAFSHGYIVGAMMIYGLL